MSGGFSWSWTMPSISSLEKCLGHRTAKSWIAIAKMKEKLQDLLMPLVRCSWMTWHASGCRAPGMDHWLFGIQYRNISPKGKSNETNNFHILGFWDTPIVRFDSCSNMEPWDVFSCSSTKVISALIILTILLSTTTFILEPFGPHS